MQISLKTLFVMAATVLSIPMVGVAQELGTPSDTAITTTDCEQAWASAEASSSCTTTVLEAEAAPGSAIVNNCAVKANCAATPGGAHDSFSDFHGGPDDVDDLKNCSGTLKLEC